ncbi:pyridoxine/pyridoxamine 5'-phosphate oxidase [Leifsonia xyli]|uniref:pyridoxine/pyridoxamine 5'-phosphate oxidase n=1 Tax=Leifsonia xyli TaxID=1575 RepID=UPI003D67CEE7
MREALAATLATTGEGGAPDARTVALRRLTADGVEFGTSSDSGKGRQLAADPRAAVVLYWRELLQQLRVTGRVERLGEAESDDLFARRTREAQAATLVSEQDAPLDDLDRLRDAARDILGAEGPIGRPERWYAYRVVPELIEFWHGSPDRLHRRLRYVRDDEGVWSVSRVQP